MSAADRRRAFHPGLDQAALIRIARAVDTKCDCASLDNLGSKLSWAKTQFRINSALRAGSSARRDRVEDVITAAKQLRSRIRALKAGDLESEPPELDGFIRSAEATILPQLSADDRAVMARLKREMHVGQRSAFEWLVGVHLPKIFDDHFGKHRKPAPYSRFACQALEEMGILNDGKPYKRQAVEKAYRDAKRGRDRKAGKST